MKYDPDQHHQRSIRLKGYDHSKNRAYFFTICVHQRECLLGEVEDAEVALSPAGQIVLHVWEDLPRRFPGVEIDAFVVMPNHVHGIVILPGPHPGTPSQTPTPVGAQFIAPNQTETSSGPSDPTQDDSEHQSQDDVASSDVKNQENQEDDLISLGVMNHKDQDQGDNFAGLGVIHHTPTGEEGNYLMLGDVVRALKAVSTRYIRKGGISNFAWQRNYHDRILRNERELETKRRYIESNPSKWSEDEENPLRGGP